MATSVLTPSEEAKKGEPERKFAEFENPRPDNLRQGSGRRKSKSSEASQKKKQPQRGMGVAQLERLRQQEVWKKMTENPKNNNSNNLLHSLSLQNNPYFLSSSPFPDPVANFGGCGVGPNQPLLLQRLGNGFFPGSGVGGVFCDQFQADPYGHRPGPNPALRGGNVSETSRELSSIPNIKVCSDYCGLCHKKKRVNGDNFGCGFLGSNLNNKLNIATERQVKPWALGPASYFVWNECLQEVEVVAVHSKGIKEGGSLLMEYEFFPGKNGGESASTKNLEIGFSEASSSVTGSCVNNTPTANSPSGFVDASSTSIDLSLKLSY
ncbi:hypothetical protein NMG60_11002299 [Bertholletia excelsa]